MKYKNEAVIVILIGSLLFVTFIPFFLGEETGNTQCEGDVCFPELRHVSVWELYLRHVDSYQPCVNELGFFTCLVIQDQTIPQIIGYALFVIIVLVVFKNKK